MTDGPTEGRSYRDARTHLKEEKEGEEEKNGQTEKTKNIDAEIFAPLCLRFLLSAVRFPLFLFYPDYLLS